MADGKQTKSSHRPSRPTSTGFDIPTDGATPIWSTAFGALSSAEQCKVLNVAAAMREKGVPTRVPGEPPLLDRLSVPQQLGATLMQYDRLENAGLVKRYCMMPDESISDPSMPAADYGVLATPSRRPAASKPSRAR